MRKKREIKLNSQSIIFCFVEKSRFAQDLKNSDLLYAPLIIDFIFLNSNILRDEHGQVQFDNFPLEKEQKNTTIRFIN